MMGKVIRWGETNEQVSLYLKEHQPQGASECLSELPKAKPAR